MNPFASSILPIRIEEELKSSYLDYSMSVIIGRALPDVRDGLKPVHRRILYAMHREGMTADRKHSKCAGVVGEVLKKYHPHGDTAVYDALVRMAQPWNLRYPLVDGQGNFGSVDGDRAAAYRYTECRMTKLAGELLIDIDKETVPLSPNFDGTHEEPDVLPSRFPNLRVTGADGLAVGMATKIPPHNLTEIVDALIALIDEPSLKPEDVLKYVPGPDFPTGGTIYGRRGIEEAYLTGRGRVLMRGNTRFEDLANGRVAIVVDEIPYQVNKARLVEQIAELVREKRIEGIHALRDESDRQGMRVVIELKHDALAEIVLNHLYKHTALQSTFGIILLSIVHQRPRVLSLLEMLQHYLSHRREVTLRRLRYELRKARERAHILEGYRIALDHLDAVIALIRASADAEEARRGLVSRFGMSPIQADAVLDLRLQRLTGLERAKIEAEHAEVLAAIARIEEILGSETLLMGVVRDELVDIRARFGDARRTQIVDARGELSLLDLVAEEHQVVTLSHLGYIKRCSTDEWRRQRRGGAGKRGMDTRAEDWVSSLFIAHTHGKLLVFTSDGTAFPLDVVEVPEAGRSARGRPIVNLVPVPEGARVAAVVQVRPAESDADEEPPPEDGPQLLFVSRQGMIKRTPLASFRHLRTSGMIACDVASGDQLVMVLLVEAPQCTVLLLSRAGKCIRFPWSEVPLRGRDARGNRGMALADGDAIVDAVILPPSESDEGEETEDEAPDDAERADVGPSLLTVTRLGIGKRTPLSEYRGQGRYGKGVKSMDITAKNGEVVRGIVVERSDQLMIATDRGRVIRIGAGEIRLCGRVSQGVRLLRLAAGENLVDIARVEEDDEVEEDVVDDDETSVDATPPEEP